MELESISNYSSSRDQRHGTFEDNIGDNYKGKISGEPINIMPIGSETTRAP